MRVIYRGQVFEQDIVELAARVGFDLVLPRDQDELMREMPDADALWITPTYYQPPIAQAARANRGRLRWIGLTSAGYDVFLRSGVPPNVITTYCVKIHGPAVAEHAVGLLLALLRQFPRALAAQAEAKWDAPALINTSRSLEDLTVSVIGMGAIGSAVAERLRPMAKRVLGVTRKGEPNALAGEMFPAARLHEVLAQSDATILTMALTGETRGMIDAAALAAMPAGAIVINMARGPVLVTEALRTALASGHLGGAGLDVTDPEPLPKDDPLWHLPGVIITPHVSTFGSIATGRRMAGQYQENLERFARGETLLGTVELPTL